MVLLVNYKCKGFTKLTPVSNLAQQLPTKPKKHDRVCKRTQQATMMGVVGHQRCVRLHGAKQKAKHLIA